MIQSFYLYIFFVYGSHHIGCRFLLWWILNVAKARCRVEFLSASNRPELFVLFPPLIIRALFPWCCYPGRCRLQFPLCRCWVEWICIRSATGQFPFKYSWYCAMACHGVNDRLASVSQQYGNSTGQAWK